MRRVCFSSVNRSPHPDQHHSSTLIHISAILVTPVISSLNLTCSTLRVPARHRSCSRSANCWLKRSESILFHRTSGFKKYIYWIQQHLIVFFTIISPEANEIHNVNGGRMCSALDGAFNNVYKNLTTKPRVIIMWIIFWSNWINI